MNAERKRVRLLPHLQSLEIRHSSNMSPGALRHSTEFIQAEPVAHRR